MSETISQKISAIINEYQSFRKGQSAGGSWQLSTLLQGLESQLRENIQQITRQEVEEIIVKLKNKQALSARDVEVMKLWIVGDSEYYLKMENSYNDWLMEIQRLMTDLSRLDIDTSDINACASARALLLDAIRVMGDVGFYLQQKERMASFSESTKEIDDAEREILINILQGKAATGKF